MHSFFLTFFSIMVYHRILNIVLCTILLFIHSIHKSLRLLTPTSHSIPPPTPSPLVITSPFSMSVILFLFFFFFFKHIHLFIWLHWVLVAAHWIFVAGAGSSLWHVGSLVVAFELLVAACGI